MENKIAIVDSNKMALTIAVSQILNAQGRKNVIVEEDDFHNYERRKPIELVCPDLPEMPSGYTIPKTHKPNKGFSIGSYKSKSKKH